MRVLHQQQLVEFCSYGHCKKVARRNECGQYYLFQIEDLDQSSSKDLCAWNIIQCKLVGIHMQP